MSVHAGIEWTDATWNPIRAAERHEIARHIVEAFAKVGRVTRIEPVGHCGTALLIKARRG